MSKSALKKVLATLTSEQKDELLLALYSARKEAKEYLDFFVNPDIDRLIDTTSASITKEIYRRGKRGFNKPRIMTIRNLIKKVATLNPGAEYVLKLHINTIRAVALAAAAGYWYTEAYAECFTRLLTEALRIADDACVLEPTVTELKEIIGAMPSSPFKRASRFMRSRLSEGLSEGLEALTKAPD
ncbi:MAG: hypothetical protein HDR92_09955 [Bacteroides sp.]|nr:hypothetical protein [Bacteroides sp.]